MSFPLAHIATLCKYTGISFIAGSVTHGVFSEQRSLITAAVGIILYLLASYLESLAEPDKPVQWARIVTFGVLASIGLGLFTGGLQHFPDSPTRSLWVVPIGFVMSVLASFWLESKESALPRKQSLTYAFAGALVVLALSVAAWFYFHGRPDASGHDHHHAAPATQSSSTSSDASAPIGPASPASAAPAKSKGHSHKGGQAHSH
jgi:hypothetical protein